MDGLFSRGDVIAQPSPRSVYDISKADHQYPTVREGTRWYPTHISHFKAFAIEKSRDKDVVIVTPTIVRLLREKLIDLKKVARNGRSNPVQLPADEGAQFYL